MKLLAILGVWCLVAFGGGCRDSEPHQPIADARKAADLVKVNVVTVTMKKARKLPQYHEADSMPARGVRV